MGAGSLATIFGTVLSAGGKIAGGVNARRAGDLQGQQADINAGQVEAASQRTAENEDRRSKLLQSRALAVAGASGGGASDPTVMDTIGRIAGEGAYRSQLALYEGSDKARSLRMQGDAARYAGKQAQAAGYMGAFSSVLKGGSTLYDKYSGKRNVLGYGSIDPTLAGEGLPY